MTWKREGDLAGDMSMSRWQSSMTWFFYTTKTNDVAAPVAKTTDETSLRVILHRL